MDRQNKLKTSLLTFLHNLFDLMILNWLWLICSLPVITMGAATCGLYTAVMKIAKGESAHPAKDFFHGFKTNWKAGLLLELAAAVVLVVAAGDVWFALAQTGALRTLYLVIAMILGTIWLNLICYTFALQAMFENPLKTQILNAFKLAVVAPGKTVSLWLVILLPVLAAVVLPPVAVGMLGFLYVVAGVSAPVYGASHILLQIFDRVNGTPSGDVPPTS